MSDGDRATPPAPLQRVNTVYDMGGVVGYGPVVVPGGESPVHAPWEERIVGMMRQVRAAVGEHVPVWRTTLQGMDGMSYLRATYWERWLWVISQRAVARGLVQEEEIEARMSEIRAGILLGEGEHRPPAARTDCSPPVPPKAPLFAEGESRRFAVGDRVLARNLYTPGHTRLPRYVRGHEGVVVRINGWYQIEDHDTQLLGPDPQPVYTVRFEAQELWGEGVARRDAVFVELWQAYLEPAAAPIEP